MTQHAFDSQSLANLQDADIPLSLETLGAERAGRMPDCANEANAPRTAAQSAQTFVVLMLPGLSMMTLAAALEPLRTFNRVVRRTAYHWRLASVDGAAITTSNGIAIPAMACQDALGGADYLFICGEEKIRKDDQRRHLALLRQAALRGISLGSLSADAHLLARAGLLTGYRCTTHWENQSVFQENFPHLNCTGKLFEIDRDRLTCSGGIATMDMVLQLIADRYGQDLARTVANELQHERIRDGCEDQRGGRLEALAQLPRGVSDAIRLMYRYIEDPLPLSTIARQIGIGTRQLERLFVRHTKMTPLRYYMNLRLEHARQLLMHSDRRIIDIAVSSGFTSTSHFATWYRRVFGTSASGMRRREQPVSANTDCMLAGS